MLRFCGTFSVIALVFTAAAEISPEEAWQEVVPLCQEMSVPN